MLILSIAIQHDSGAALINDGKIIAAVNEERLNRKKLYWGIPERSIEEVFKIAGVKPSDVEFVTFSNLMSGNKIDNFTAAERDFNTKVLQSLSSIGIASVLTGTEPGIKLIRAIFTTIKHKNFKRTIQYLGSIGVKAPVKFIEHHESHAASAYYTSGWNECLVVTSDAAGDGYCSKVFVAKDGKMELIQQIPFYHSIGYYYSYITHICGFREGHHEGKITGLAAYGNPKETFLIFQKEVSYNPGKFSTENRGRYLWPEINYLKKRLKGYSKKDIAAGIQYHLETNMVSYIKDAIKKTGQKRIALAGGVFANVKLNQRIREIEGVEGVFIHPHMGDGGLAVGAGLYLWAKESLSQGKYKHLERLKDVYFGPSYSKEEIEQVLKKEGLNYYQPDCIETEIANLLAQGKVIARFAGRMEYGPRALMNRSILYQATDVTVNDWLNKKLKRTEFMPFAPVILEENAPYFLKDYDERSSHTAQFMTITYDVTERCKKEAPAIVHVDGTARPQIITKETSNPSARKILEEYKKLTGLSILINTSFNMHEEPIVCSPEDAVRAFKLGELDILAIEDFMVGE
ncbi:MAG: carbamoyltransferase C-terminal domain-containing protein [bacterium]